MTVSERASRILPMIGAASSEDRDRDGWELRFVAEGRRAEEMIALYRELGYEVAVDAVSRGGVTDAGIECLGCRSTAKDRFLAIYTRRVDDP